MYIIFVQNVWICWKVDCLELSKFNGKLCTLNVRNVRICREIEYPELHKLNKKFRTLFLHEMSGFAEIRNSTGNCTHYIYTKCLDFWQNWISTTTKIQREIVYIIYVRNFWICRKIEYPELGKFNGKLYTLYIYEMSGFLAKLNLHNYENSIGNCLHYICTEFLNLQKNWISRTREIQREIVYVICT